MNVVSSSSTKKSLDQQQQQLSKTTTNPKQKQQDTIINFYDETPNFELSIDDFEVYALKRLKVLRAIEQYRNFRNIDSKKIDEKIEEKINELKLYNKFIDNASHYILRLSYCRTEELRNWFCKYECDLFRYRMKKFLSISLATSATNNNSNNEKLKKMISEYANVQPISYEEKESLRDLLLKLMSLREYSDQTIYAVPFTQVLNLIANRTCLLRNGKVYVPESYVIDILVSKFRMNLSRDLTYLGKYNNFTDSNNNQSSSSMAEDDPESVRIRPIIDNLHKVLLNREAEVDPSLLSINGLGETPLTSNTVNSLVENMPLCMRLLNKGMKQDKKLKYNGRLQYTLFLKGAGLSLDESINYFQRNYTAVSTEEFNKQYAYAIRHIYGQEGKRESKRAYNCIKIIVGSPSPTQGQHHGCPYKHYDDDNLLRLLQSMNIGTNSSDRKEILHLKKQNQYQLACQKHFDIQHPNSANTGINLDNVGNHPNAWFRASKSYYDNMKTNQNDISFYDGNNNSSSVKKTYIPGQAIQSIATPSPPSQKRDLSCLSANIESNDAPETILSKTFDHNNNEVSP